MIPPGERHSLRLCATFVRTVKVPGRYGYGGHGLSLPATPRESGGFSKTWAHPNSPNGTKTSHGLGFYPVVTLAMARALAEGRGPRRRFQQVPTFAKANETVIAIHANHWKSERTEGQWRTGMRDHVLPRLARKRVDAVTTADVMAVLLPIRSTRRVTAGRVRCRSCERMCGVTGRQRPTAGVVRRVDRCHTRASGRASHGKLRLRP